MASGIKTFRSLRFFVLAFDTTSPSTRAAAWTAAGFTASRESHPREALSRPPSLLDPRITGGWDWTGVSLSLTESLRTQPATGCFSGGWDRFAPYLAVIDAGCPAQVVLAHPPASLAPLLEPRQERIQVVGYSLFKLHERAMENPPHFYKEKVRGSTKIIFTFREVFLISQGFYACGN